MEFNRAYSRDEFLSFLRVNFLPEDFRQEISNVENPVQFQYTRQVTRLGECESLGLVVYEVRHSSKHDARVGLTKEAFRLLADEFCERALVFFVPEDDNNNYRFSLIEITLDQSETSSRVSRRYSNPHRYSYYLGKGIAYYTPNKYLNEYGRVVSVEDLRNRFSVDVLTKAFYQELSDWYAWSITKVHFPNDLKTLEDNQKYNSEAMIRLITRLIFVWFLKQRHLVPDEFFDEQYICSHLLKNFTPNAKVTLFGKVDNSYYYKGILQNLFFAMLNSPITPEGEDTISERRFRNGRGDYDNNKLMRHEELFIDPDLFVRLANKYVPFLNGGLFDCLDDKDKGIYIDAFTDRDSIAKQLIVPDYIFFGEEAGKNIDLSEYYGDKKKKKVSARGIIDILKRYNFTVEENTPFDQEVSLDPELLGKVFENLLAAYNPETQTTARKQTGSFYTPREIVQYMVDESLIAHLKRTVGEALEPEYRKLVRYTDEELNLTNEQKRQIMQSLYECKVLDPACGSGAFPMGMLQQMVHILGQLDPNNEQWKDMMLNNAISETSEAYHNATDEERAEIVADIERSFNESINRPDYARKLYLIENCIYGVDIQPIAIQISKLRFFISLVVDQKTNNNPVDNFGIRPLPNLEAKFVAANTLIGLEKKEANIFDSDAIREKEKELKEAKHRIFSAKTVKTKRKYKERVTTLRTEIAEMLNESGAIGNEEAQQLSSWDMFDQNATSPFFDPEWMFGVNGGFDVVIGNPPYIRPHHLSNEVKTQLWNHFKTYEKKADIYVCFMEKALCLAGHQGLVTFIVSDGWLRLDSFEKTRNYILRTANVDRIVDFTSDVFDSATVKTCIVILSKGISDNHYLLSAVIENKINLYNLTYCEIAQLEYHSTYKNVFDLSISSKGTRLKQALQNCTVPLGERFQLSFGLKTGDDEQFLTFNPSVSPFCKKLVRGADINRWSISFKGEYVIYKPLEMRKNKKTARPGTSERFEQVKVLVRDTGGGLMATYDDEKYYVKDVIIIEDAEQKPELLKMLCTLLNSKIMRWFYETTFPTLHVQRDELASLPLPQFIFRAEIQSKFVNIARSILEAKRDDPQADTSALENKIDKKVYHLYGLTYDEVLIVDPNPPFTREEYERD